MRFDRREQDAVFPASESTVISVVLIFEIACSANSRVGMGETFQFENGNSEVTNCLKSQDVDEEEEGHMGEVKPSAADIAAKLRREERKKKQTAWYSSSSSDDETFSALPSEPAHHRSWGGAFRALYLSFSYANIVGPWQDANLEVSILLLLIRDQDIKTDACLLSAQFCAAGHTTPEAHSGGAKWRPQRLTKIDH